jgi:hypothetical protein
MSASKADSLDNFQTKYPTILCTTRSLIFFLFFFLYSYLILNLASLINYKGRLTIEYEIKPCNTHPWIIPSG